jgi:hypothetical protein
MLFCKILYNLCFNIQWNLCNPTSGFFDILWHPMKIYDPKLFLLTKIKPENSDILYNPTHFPAPLVCWIDRFHCIKKNGSFQGRDRYCTINISASMIGRTAILVIMYVETFKTDAIVVIGYIILCLRLHWPIIWLHWPIIVSIRVSSLIMKISLD